MFAGFFLYGLPFNKKGLSNVWKVKVVVKLCCSPYLTDFNTSVIRRVTLHEIWFLAVLEEQLDVF